MGFVKRFLVGSFSLFSVTLGGIQSLFAEATSFHFCALGDMPYELPNDLDRFENVIRVINAQAPVFTAHIGDTKSGGSPCSNKSMDRTWQSFATFDHPLVYTPGDNEWTDCHREAAGGMDPLERLDALRKKFFSNSSTLGGGNAV